MKKILKAGTFVIYQHKEKSDYLIIRDMSKKKHYVSMPKLVAEKLMGMLHFIDGETKIEVKESEISLMIPGHENGKIKIDPSQYADLFNMDD